MKTRGISIIAVLALLIPAVVNSDSVQPFLAGYADSEANYVVTGALQYQNRILERYNLGAKGVVDAISSASTKAGTDGTTGATQRRTDRPDGYVGGFTDANSRPGIFSETPNFQDSRVELSGYFGGEFAESALTGGAIYSYEELYKSTTLYGTFRQNFALQNTVLVGTYYHNFDSVDTSEQAVKDRYDYPKDKNVDGAALSLTQILSRRTIGQLALTYADYTGAMSDPVREVWLHQTSGLNRIVTIPERLPARRKRTAGSARINQYLWHGSSLQLGYRYYTDDWDIRSSTFEGEWFVSLGRYALLGLHGRYYTQSESKYLAFDVVKSDHYFSASPLMESFDSQMVGARLHFFDRGDLFDEKARLSGGLKVDSYTQTSREGVPEGFQAVIGMANILVEY